MKWVAVVLLSLVAMAGLGIALLAALVRSVNEADMPRKVVAIGLASFVVSAALATLVVRS